MDKTNKNIHIKLFVKAHCREKSIKIPSVQSDFFKVFTIIIISRSILPGKTTNYLSLVALEVHIHELYKICVQGYFCIVVELQDNLINEKCFHDFLVLELRGIKAC